jgi:hypothetical protein
MSRVIFGWLMLICINAQAEVYRWTDANGKVHFGDKKPKVAAEDITDKVKQTNVDTSTSEHQKLETLFRKENQADREYKQQQAQPDLQLLHRCIEAKKYLDTINGRVQFIDATGKEVKVTEEERKQKVIAMQKEIKENCSN